MVGTFCKYVGRFDRGQLFRRYCVRCVYNTAHLGDAELRCPYLEYRIIYPANRRGKIIPGREPAICIPTDLRE